MFPVFTNRFSFFFHFPRFFLLFLQESRHLCPSLNTGWSQCGEYWNTNEIVLVSKVSLASFLKWKVEMLRNKITKKKASFAERVWKKRKEKNWRSSTIWRRTILVVEDACGVLRVIMMICGGNNDASPANAPLWISWWIKRDQMEAHTQL